MIWYRKKICNLIPTKTTEGAARVKVKTIDEMKLDKEEARKNASNNDKKQMKVILKRYI